MNFYQISSQWLILAIIILIALGFLVFIFRLRQDNEKSEDIVPGGIKSNVAPDTQVADKNRKLLILIALGVAFFVAGLVVFMASDRSGSGDDRSSMPMMAIWIAIFVPIIASKQKRKNKKLTDKQKEFKKMIILLILGLSMALGIIVLYFVK